MLSADLTVPVLTGLIVFLLVIIGILLVLCWVIKSQMAMLKQNSAALHGSLTELRVNKAYAEGGMEAARVAATASHLSGIATAEVKKEPQSPLVSKQQIPSNKPEPFVIKQGIGREE
jgi:hypothetical protein